MDENQVVWNGKVAKKLMKKLEGRRMEGSYAVTAAQANEEVISMFHDQVLITYQVLNEDKEMYVFPGGQDHGHTPLAPG